MKEISIDHLSYNYNRHHSISPHSLTNISFKITQGSVLGIFGPTGAGKTTLILLICGLLCPDHGKILIDGIHPFDQKDGWENYRNKIKIVFQFPEDIFLHDSVAEEFLKILESKGHTKVEAKQLAYKALEWAGLDPQSIWSRHPLYLSHSQLRLLSLAFVRIQEWDLLLLDEPTVGLNYQSKKRILYDIVHKCHSHKKMCIIASHDMAALLPLIDYGLILYNGELILHDTRENILNNTESLYNFGLSIPPITELAIKLKKAGLPIHQVWQDLEQAVTDIMQIIPVRYNKRINHLN